MFLAKVAKAVSDAFEKYRLIRRAIVLWAAFEVNRVITLISWTVRRTFSDKPPVISEHTATALSHVVTLLAVVIGLLTLAIGFYKWSRFKEMLQKLKMPINTADPGDKE